MKNPKVTGVYLSQKNLQFKKLVVNCLQADYSLVEAAKATGYKCGSFSKKVVALFGVNYSELKRRFVSESVAMSIVDAIPEIDDIGVIVNPYDDEKFSLLIESTKEEDREQAAWMQMVQDQIKMRRLMVALAYPRQ